MPQPKQNVMKRLLVGSVTAAVVGAVVLAYSIGRARAYGIPQTSPLTYSGTLLSYGQPANGAHQVTLNLKVGDTVACTTPAGSTQFVNGRFSVPLDSSCTSVIHQNQNVQVEVVVDGTSLGLSPLGAVPYAVEADTASNVAPNSALATQLDPPGTVIAYAGRVGGAGNVPPPAGWLYCNGQAVSRTQYAGLFAAIDVMYGKGDGSTTFNLPDYRGYFLRGWNDSAGRDPDAASRGAMASGGDSGDTIGSVEGGAFASHSHGVNDPGHNHGFTGANPIGQSTTGSGNPGFSGAGLYAPTNYVGLAPATTNISIQAAGGSENRPINASVAYLIKY